ncbi:zinc-ribbon domain-containing protein [Neorhodopirellula pilleata]|nr:zinc ribbon domain-containing protein [Neorhodopirellula pilleata]
MNLTRTRQTGDFYCPTCGVTQSYRLRARRPFLTLYFIPTVPIGQAELFVHCDHCKSNWDPGVLNMDQVTHQRVQAEQYKDEAIRSAVLIALQDGDITEPQVQALLHLADMMFDRPIEREELGRLCSIARQAGIRPHNYVLTISKRWTMTQRLLALQAMFLVATASEEDLSDEMVKTLISMRDLLQLTENEFQIAIEDTLQYRVA